MTAKKIAQMDHGFDGISDKFAKNIYGTTKGQLRHALLCHHLSTLNLVNTPPKQILDSGCGLGQMAEFFADAGHHVEGWTFLLSRLLMQNSKLRINTYQLIILLVHCNR